ncbi:HET-domain-containing protein, partial [Saccharata proteae CBS 121410]
YAALSYCWGPRELPPPLTTKTTSFRHRRESIPMALMQKTLQDAVAITRSLGIQYIWIDSLCIVQDDVSDWERESQQMADVYTNAFVTICAARGSSCHDGFLDRQPRPCVEVGFASSIEPTIKGHYFISQAASMHPHLGLSSWMNRGWTFQEHQLSPRKLLFLPDLVALSCRAKLQIENRLDPIAALPSWFDEWNQLSRLSPQTLYDTWHNAVSSYSSTALSFPTDRFPALSGLAKRLAVATNDEYVAGLWKQDRRGLLWFVLAPHAEHTLADYLTSSRREGGYIAPSWSWA